MSETTGVRLKGSPKYVMAAGSSLTDSSDMCDDPFDGCDDEAQKRE
jgi:hypothetical protein